MFYLLILWLPYDLWSLASLSVGFKTNKEDQIHLPTWIDLKGYNFHVVVFYCQQHLSFCHHYHLLFDLLSPCYKCSAHILSHHHVSSSSWVIFFPLLVQQIRIMINWKHPIIFCFQHILIFRQHGSAEDGQWCMPHCNCLKHWQHVFL